MGCGARGLAYSGPASEVVLLSIDVAPPSVPGTPGSPPSASLPPNTGLSAVGPAPGKTPCPGRWAWGCPARSLQLSDVLGWPGGAQPGARAGSGSVPAAWALGSLHVPFRPQGLAPFVTALPHIHTHTPPISSKGPWPGFQGPRGGAGHPDPFPGGCWERPTSQPWAGPVHRMPSATAARGLLLSEPRFLSASASSPTPAPPPRPTPAEMPTHPSPRLPFSEFPKRTRSSLRTVLLRGVVRGRIWPG